MVNFPTYPKRAWIKGIAALTLAFVLLRASGVIAWAWGWTLVPIWGSFLIYYGLVIPIQVYILWRMIYK